MTIDYPRALALANRIAETWTQAWIDDADNQQSARYCTLDDLTEHDQRLAQSIFQQVVGKNMWGDIAGLRVDGELIAIVPDGEADGFILLETRYPDERASLQELLLPEVMAGLPPQAKPMRLTDLLQDGTNQGEHYIGKLVILNRGEVQARDGTMGHAILIGGIIITEEGPPLSHKSESEQWDVELTVKVVHKRRGTHAEHRGTLDSLLMTGLDNPQYWDEEWLEESHRWIAIEKPY